MNGTGGETVIVYENGPQREVDSTHSGKVNPTYPAFTT